MPLSICVTDDERLVCGAAEHALREGLAQGSATLLVPSLTQALAAQKELAQRDGFSLGVEVGTPASWARERWDVWGDGRRTVDAATRLLLMESVVPPALDTPGTVELLSGLAESYLVWLEGCKIADGVLTEAETAAVRLLDRYACALRGHGLVEGSEIMVRLGSALRAAGVPVGTVVICGFDEMNRAERVLVVELARHAPVTFVAHSRGTAASEEAMSLAATLEDEAREAGVPVTRAQVPLAARVDRDAELDALLSVLFEPGVAPLSQASAVRLLEPAGPLAEAELIAREVDEAVSRGNKTVAVAVCDPARAWRELVPKLVARGHTVRAHMSVPVLSTHTGRAFMAYARMVALLSELDASWPAPQTGADGSMVRLGDMSWWAPAALTDFLLCDVAQVPHPQVWALDASWRANRLLTPADALNQLLSASKTSDAVGRATRELLKGRLGSAASRLLAAFAPGGEVKGEHDLAREESVSALAAVIGVAATLRELGVSADRVPDALLSAGAEDVRGQGCSLSQLVSYAERALRDVRVRLRPRVQGTGAVNVCVMGRGEAAQCGPASYDVLVLCGLSSDKTPIPTGDDVFGGIVEALGIDRTPNPLCRERARFARMVAAARHTLLLERPLFTELGEHTYPAVLLGELTACYADGLQRAGCSETPAAARVRACGLPPQPVNDEDVAPAGQLDDTTRRLVMVPPEGTAELPGGLPTLSASQLESYLECPLKWFSLRRLRLSDCDAGFGPLEMGTFVHRVLELTYGQLVEEGWTRARGGVKRARETLEANFAAHRAHQYMCSGSRTPYQALVAHTVAEETQYDRLLRDLTTLIDYQADRLEGFEPRYFEWEFGRGDEWVEYAGARVTGTVDRIDVNAHGQAIVIDYKHKGPKGFFGEYAAFGKEGREADSPLELPRRIQALMYAQVVRRAFPDLQVVGALYLGTRGDHELSGAVGANLAEHVFGGGLSSKRSLQVEVDPFDTFGLEQGGAKGMNALLDACEDAVARKVELLRAGQIPAAPLDAKACNYCPVNNCERRKA